MTEYVAETYEEVRELLQTASWEIMDEEQRDDVMRKVVMPRWGKVTADGVVLKGTAWAKLLGTTEDTMRGRYRRLTARSEGTDERSRAGLSENERKQVRHARSIIRNRPEVVDELLSDPDVTEAVEQAVASDPAATARVNQKAAAARPAPIRPEPTRSSMSAAASLAALERWAAEGERVADDVIADVMDGHADPKLLAEPVASVQVTIKRLEIASTTDQRIDEGLADLLRKES